jgi:hypothetical protein
LAVGGKELDKPISEKDDPIELPFISIHEIEPNFPLHGTNDPVIKYTDGLSDEEIAKLTPSLREEICTQLKGAKVSYKIMEDFNTCIYNLEFLNTERNLIAGSDFNAHIFILEISQSDYSLNTLQIVKMHDGNFP